MQVSRSVAKLSAYRVALVAKIQASQVWRDKDPNATPVTFLREELVVDHHEAKADLRAAAPFERFPELAQACQDGRVSRDKMDLILRIGSRNPARERALPRFMNIFIDLAATAPTSQLRRALELWADQIDPVTTARDEDDAHHRRELHVVQRGDGVKVDGFFGKTQGMQLMAALNGALDKQWRDTHNTAGSRAGASGAAGAAGGGEVPVAERVAASTAAQRADAFIDAIIMPVLDNKLLPTSGGAPATICVTVPLTRLQNPTAATNHGDIADRLADGTLRLGSASIRATNGPAESVISSLAALEISCDANVQRIVMTPAGKPLDIGRKPGSSPNKSGPHSSFATAAASTQCATNRVLGPTGITSNTGHAADQPAWTTSPYCAPRITTKSTPTTFPSPSTPTANPESTSNTHSNTEPEPTRQDCPPPVGDAGTRLPTASRWRRAGLSTAS